MSAATVGVVLVGRGPVARVYFHHMGDYLRIARDLGVVAMLGETCHNWAEAPKYYVQTRLYWDPDADVDALLEEWYELAVGAEAARAGPITATTAVNLVEAAVTGSAAAAPHPGPGPGRAPRPGAHHRLLGRGPTRVPTVTVRDDTALSIEPGDRMPTDTWYLTVGDDVVPFWNGARNRRGGTLRYEAGGGRSGGRVVAQGVGFGTVLWPRGTEWTPVAVTGRVRPDGPDPHRALDYLLLELEVEDLAAGQALEIADLALYSP